ncbi:DUF3413 domain-containing protein [Aliiglaciecola litoralis]|uniref:Inner membrane protein YejM N-terminal domain-containing protein n=1 Tax=Aliiglaciecola litoralis TaxID=582857 RepID=A0ABP3WW07_9ALTE
MILSETPRRIMVTKLVSWGHWFALSNIIIAIIIASIYVFATPLPDSFIGVLFLLLNWFSHIGFLTFIGFVIFILPLIYAVPKSRVIRGVGSSMAALALALLAFDALLYTKYGLHLSLSSADLIRTETQTVINAFGWQEWSFLLLLFLVWLTFQLVLANALWKRIERVQKFRIGVPISGFFVACFVSSHALHVWADAKLYQPIIKQDNLFPLSYPATAKTLMSKYGLLDLENYKNRKSLQFDTGIKGIKYPANPVYCSINNNQSLVILIQTDNQKLPLGFAELRQYDDHYDLSSNNQSAKLTSLFGLPEIYLSELQSHLPIMLDLPQKLGLPISLYSGSSLDHDKIDEVRIKYTEFKQRLVSTQPTLAIGFVTNQQIKQLVTTELLNQKQVIITQLSANRDDIESVPLLANFELSNNLSSHLDIPATALGVLGCAANVEDYSVGQSIQTPRRSWLVGTKGSKVIVLHNGNRIEVLGNGNYKIYDRLNDEESTESLNTGLLGQAMKHLTRFTK